MLVVLGRRLRFALAATAFALLAGPVSAGAQACCTATGSGEFGLVGPCHDAAVAVQLSHQQIVASYGPTGSVAALRNATYSDTLSSVGGGIRIIDRRLELGFVTPLRLQLRRIDQDASLGFGVGDVFAGARLTTLRDTTTGIKPGVAASYEPFLDLLAGLRFPSGRPPEAATDPLGADAMGTGDWETSLGFKLTKFLTLTHSVALGLVWGHRYTRSLEGPAGRCRFSPGERLTLRASWTYIANFRWSGGGFVAASFHTAARRDGVPVEDSESHQTTLGGFLNWAFDFPDWELSLSLTVDPLFPGAGRNISYAGPTVALFLKRGFMASPNQADD